MLYIVFLIVCFGASLVGAICGIGGGVIIKPALDVFKVMDAATISFLSGCTVLAMTTYSVMIRKKSGESHTDSKTRFPLAIGAVTGGLIGKALLHYISITNTDKQELGAIQAICLLIVTIGTLVYTIFKKKIKTYHLTNTAVCILIGLILGAISSFLGIGGGPINLVILFFFFSMSTKTAAENSLYIIFFSQLASLIQTLVTGSVPEFETAILIFMVFGGICGGICGHSLNKKIKERTVDNIFILLMIVIIVINIYNIYTFI